MENEGWQAFERIRNIEWYTRKGRIKIMSQNVNKNIIVKEDLLEAVHSSNSVFNFMKKLQYLKDVIQHKRIVPRYCEENIEYLNLSNDGKILKVMYVLQKCFCDIPLHNIVKEFKIFSLDENSLENIENKVSHLDLYGEYGIAFSKSWAINNRLQPVRYLNVLSVEEIKNYFDFLVSQNDIEQVLLEDLFIKFSYLKPINGVMKRPVDNQERSFEKNFHDECEWRFVPSMENHPEMSAVMFNESFSRKLGMINLGLSDNRYKDLWLNFDYEDIRYLIVPTDNDRLELIKLIDSLDIDKEEKYLLISKVEVTDRIKGDF